MRAYSRWGDTYIVARLHVALPAQLTLVNVQMPRRFGVHIAGCVRLLRRRRTFGGVEHRSEPLRRVLGVEILCLHASGRVRAWGTRPRRRLGRSACDEDIALNRGRKAAKENVVDMFADQATCSTC